MSPASNRILRLLLEFYKNDITCLSGRIRYHSYGGGRGNGADARRLFELWPTAVR